MTRSIYGNLTSNTARLEIADQRSWLHEVADRAAAEAVQKNKDRFNSLQQKMVEVLGEEEFSAWYDDDGNVPNELHWREMEPIFEKMEAIIERAGRPAASERPASNEPGCSSHTARGTKDPADCITDKEGK